MKVDKKSIIGGVIVGVIAFLVANKFMKVKKTTSGADGDYSGMCGEPFLNVEGEFYNEEGDFRSDDGDFYDADGDYVGADGTFVSVDDDFYSAEGNGALDSKTKAIVGKVAAVKKKRKAHAPMTIPQMKTRLNRGREKVTKLVKAYSVAVGNPDSKEADIKKIGAKLTKARSVVASLEAALKAK